MCCVVGFGALPYPNPAQCPTKQHTTRERRNDTEQHLNKHVVFSVVCVAVVDLSKLQPRNVLCGGVWYPPIHKPRYVSQQTAHYERTHQ